MSEYKKLMAWTLQTPGEDPLIVLAGNEQEVYEAVERSFDFRGIKVAKSKIFARRAPQYDFLGEEDDDQPWPSARMLVFKEESIDWVPA